MSASTLGVFVRPLTEELSWSRAMICGNQSVSTSVTGRLAPWMGPLRDRRGGRAVIIMGASSSGGTLICLSQVDHRRSAEQPLVPQL